MKMDSFAQRSKKRRTDRGPALFDRGMFLDTVKQERGTADHQFLTQLLSSANDQHIYRDEFDTMLSYVSLSGRLDLLRFLREVLKQLEQDELQMKQDELQMELQKKQEKSRSQAAVQLIDAISDEIPMNRTKDILEQFTHGVLRSAESLRVFLKSLGFPEHNITGSIALYFNEIPERHHLSVLAHYLTENEAHLMIPNHFLTDIPDIAGHFLANWMMIRSHYIHMADIALKHGDDQPILICGDPGIGKSLFSLYMFFRLVVEGEAVVRVSQGGAAIYYDPLMDHGTAFRFEPHFDKHKSDWLDARWWLLVDEGMQRVPFVDKRNRLMAFTSSQEQLRGVSSFKDRGLTLCLPPWSDAEVENLVKGMPHQTILDLCSKWKALHGVIVNGYRRETFLDHIRERKKIVGGRIRFLLHPSHSLTDLEHLMEQSASQFNQDNNTLRQLSIRYHPDLYPHGLNLCCSLIPQCVLHAFEHEFSPTLHLPQRQQKQQIEHHHDQYNASDYMHMHVRICTLRVLLYLLESQLMDPNQHLMTLVCGSTLGHAWISQLTGRSDHDRDEEEEEEDVVER